MSCIVAAADGLLEVTKFGKFLRIILWNHWIILIAVSVHITTSETIDPSCWNKTSPKILTCLCGWVVSKIYLPWRILTCLWKSTTDVLNWCSTKSAEIPKSRFKNSVHTYIKILIKGFWVSRLVWPNLQMKTVIKFYPTCKNIDSCVDIMLKFGKNSVKSLLH